VKAQWDVIRYKFQKQYLRGILDGLANECAMTRERNRAVAQGTKANDGLQSSEQQFSGDVEMEGGAAAPSLAKGRGDNKSAVAKDIRINDMACANSITPGADRGGNVVVAGMTGKNDSTHNDWIEGMCRSFEVDACITPQKLGNGDKMAVEEIIGDREIPVDTCDTHAKTEHLLAFEDNDEVSGEEDENGDENDSMALDNDTRSVDLLKNGEKKKAANETLGMENDTTKVRGLESVNIVYGPFRSRSAKELGADGGETNAELTRESVNKILNRLSEKFGVDEADVLVDAGAAYNIFAIHAAQVLGC